VNSTVHELCEAIGMSLAKVVTREADGVGKPFQQMRLVIVTPSGIDDGSFYPAESVDIYSLTQIIKLRDLLNRAIAIAHKGATAEPVVEALNQQLIEKP
jgi:hypothetical protein